MGSSPITLKHGDLGVVSQYHRGSLDKFLKLHIIIISQSYGNDTMITFHDHEPASVILTLLDILKCR